MKNLATAGLLVFALLLGVGGCSPKASVPKDDFFARLLRDHGETNLVADADGVGLAGNPTRLACSLYGSDRSTNGDISAEMEFRVRLPGGQQIIEYVSGRGNTWEKAIGDAQANFVMTTFHVVYRSFLNPKDPHQLVEPITINGQPRELVLGDTMTRGGHTNSLPDLSAFRDRFRQLMASQPLSPQVHWVKIIYANYHSKVMLCEVTLDNHTSPALTEAVKQMPWPPNEEFYMVKQFLVVK